MDVDNIAAADDERIFALSSGADDDEADTSGLSSSVAKALRLLCTFSPGQRSIGVSELARRAELPKSTAFRLLSILAASGFIERSKTSYTLGPRVSELAQLAIDSNWQRLRDNATPFLQDLFELTHETVHLAVLDGADVVYLNKIHGHTPVNSPSRIGARFPAACSALGKAIMAFSGDDKCAGVAKRLKPMTPYSIVAPNALRGALDSVREDGVAYDLEEAAIGVTCVAAPIIGRKGTPVGAVSIAGATVRFNPQRYAAAVRQAAAGIGRTVYFA